MSVWNKVLIGLIALAALVQLFLGAKVLKWHQGLRAGIAALETQIEQTEAQNRQLYLGAEAGRGLPDLRVAVSRSVAGRGRVWDQVTVVVADDGTITATVAAPQPHQIAVNQSLFAFEWPAEPAGVARYAGEFKVASVVENQITLAAALKLDAPGLERLRGLVAGGKPWTLFELMPMDRHDVFRGLSMSGQSLVPALADADRRGVLAAHVADRMSTLPADAQQTLVDRLDREFRLDGQAPQATDGEVPPERLRDGLYERPLIDFASLFHELERQRTIALDTIAAHQLEIQYTQQSLDDARKQQQFMEQLRGETREQLAKLTRERDAVAAHRQHLADQLDEVRSAIARLAAANREMAGQLAAAQRQALEGAPVSPEADLDTAQADLR